MQYKYPVITQQLYDKINEKIYTKQKQQFQYNQRYLEESHKKSIDEFKSDNTIVKSLLSSKINEIHTPYHQQSDKVVIQLEKEDDLAVSNVGNTIDSSHQTKTSISTDLNITEKTELIKPPSTYG